MSQLSLYRSGAGKYAVSAIITMVLIIGMHSMAYAQYVRSCGKASPLTAQGAAPLTDAEGRPYLGTEKLRFVPSLCVSERYDSNVFFIQKTPGLNRADFVTDVNPQLRVSRDGEYIGAILDLGGFYETYARNSDLNFFGTADSLYLNFDKSIKRLFPNASLTVSDNVRYTPTPPGFSNAVPGTNPAAPVNIQNVYAQGILSYRTNNISNTAAVSAGYKITPLTTLSAAYSYSFIRFGSSPLNSVQLFNSTTQTGTLTATTEVTALDALFVNYSRVQFSFSPHTTSAPTTTSFGSNTAVLGWKRTITPYLTGSVGGGLIVLDPNTTTYAVNASLVLNTPNNTATLGYVRSAFPSFVAVGVPVIADIVSLSAVQKLALNWELDEYGGYSHSSGTSGETTVGYDSFSAGMDLYYWITKNWSAALSFDYTNFNQTFGQTTNQFDRYAVTFSLKATLN